MPRVVKRLVPSYLFFSLVSSVLLYLPLRLYVLLKILDNKFQIIRLNFI